MDAHYHCALLRVLFTACNGLGEFARGTGQRSLFGTEKAGIGDLFASRYIRKAGEPHINADCFWANWQSLLLQLCLAHLDTDAHIPFTLWSAFHNRRLRPPFDRPVHYHLDVPQLAEHKRSLVLFGSWQDVKAIAVLLKGQGVIA